MLVYFKFIVWFLSPKFTFILGFENQLTLKYFKLFWSSLFTWIDKAPNAKNIWKKSAVFQILKRKKLLITTKVLQMSFWQNIIDQNGRSDYFLKVEFELWGMVFRMLLNHSFPNFRKLVQFLTTIDIAKQDTI